VVLDRLIKKERRKEMINKSRLAGLISAVTMFFSLNANAYTLTVNDGILGPASGYCTWIATGSNQVGYAWGPVTQTGEYTMIDSIVGITAIQGGFTQAGFGLSINHTQPQSNEYWAEVAGSGASASTPTAITTLGVPASSFNPSISKWWNGNFSVTANAGQHSSINMIPYSTTTAFCYLTGVTGELNGGFVGVGGSVNYELLADATGSTPVEVWGECVEFAGNHTITNYGTYNPYQLVALPNAAVAFCAITGFDGNWNYNSSQGETWGGIVGSGDNNQNLVINIGDNNTGSGTMDVTCVNYDN
jgi:hypothetical protein